MEKHSKQLFDSLYNWEEKYRNQMEVLEREETQLLDLMLKYDHKVDLKKNAILIAMQEMLNKESQHLANSDELKEFNQMEIRMKINQMVRHLTLYSSVLIPVLSLLGTITTTGIRGVTANPRLSKPKYHKSDPFD